VESPALLESTKGQDCLATSVAPSHPRALEALSDQRLARRLDDARADRHVSQREARVAHAVAVVPEVLERRRDLLAARVLIPQVAKMADHLLDSVAVVPKDVAVLLELEIGRAHV